MATFVRGFNPIWLVDDLSGNLLDDTYYFFVMQNTNHSMPAIIYSDPSGMIPIANPVRFLANGTLPVDIYYDPGTSTDPNVYYLEIRQGNTQSDPLIYSIENYVPSNAGGNSGDFGFSTDNQIANPQFAVIDFQSPFTLTGVTNPASISVGPGWFLDLVGTGNITLTQVPLNDDPADVNPSNAPYALEINVTGSWTSVILKQRFQQNGNLWANKIVSSAITARIESSLSTNTIVATMVDSEGHTLGDVIPINTTVTANYSEFTGHATFPDPNDSQLPPVSYIEYQLHLPVSVDIFVTSIQLTVSSLPVEPNFAQTSIDRQIDQIYHVAYPIVPVGTIIDFFGFNIPAHYTPCNYALLNRLTYSQLFRTITNTETVALNSTATFTVANGLLYSVGYGVEGIGIQATTTITNVSMNIITISLPATVTGSHPITFFAAGNIFAETVTWQSSTTFDVANGAAYRINQAISGLNIPVNTIISNITVNLITISNASFPPYLMSDTSVVYFYDPANGDGSITFNAPDLRRRNTIGSGGNVISPPPLGIGNHFGNIGGEERHIQLQNEVGLHVHGSASGNFMSTGATLLGSGGANGFTPNQYTDFNVYTAPQVGINLFQPSVVTNKCIRFE